eukprot:gnl/TRDRNA2_/TRDRNA2_172116_c0_seq2.p1 gnl/TRDRNA2_/TRDRNA2_172116_c0~~gnl/TRDRNA2_/TRDRNA2_172116_c0_seq2.p1  ORF type:complete len:491 (+),score=78.07 gnl/TRDRNA2_/TRDRNA2_172116_c0_seq2:19-1491(+)
MLPQSDGEDPATPRKGNRVHDAATTAHTGVCTTQPSSGSMCVTKVEMERRPATEARSPTASTGVPKLDLAPVYTYAAPTHVERVNAAAEGKQAATPLVLRSLLPPALESDSEDSREARPNVEIGDSNNSSPMRSTQGSGQGKRSKKKEGQAQVQVTNGMPQGPEGYAAVSPVSAGPVGGGYAGSPSWHGGEYDQHTVYNLPAMLGMESGVSPVAAGYGSMWSAMSPTALPQQQSPLAQPPQAPPSLLGLARSLEPPPPPDAEPQMPASGAFVGTSVTTPSRGAALHSGLLATQAPMATATWSDAVPPPPPRPPAQLAAPPSPVGSPPPLWPASPTSPEVQQWHVHAQSPTGHVGTPTGYHLPSTPATPTAFGVPVLPAMQSQAQQSPAAMMVPNLQAQGLQKDSPRSAILTLCGAWGALAPSSPDKRSSGNEHGTLEGADENMKLSRSKLLGFRDLAADADSKTGAKDRLKCIAVKEPKPKSPRKKNKKS